jgi:hypothetical protein
MSIVVGPGLNEVPSAAAAAGKWLGLPYAATNGPIAIALGTDLAMIRGNRALRREDAASERHMAGRARALAKLEADRRAAEARRKTSGCRPAPAPYTVTATGSSSGKWVLTRGTLGEERVVDGMRFAWVERAVAPAGAGPR